ncbi:MAG: DUF3244 domain-containing protein [Paludibacter sp.]|nr:DUF3244 domain-containing protein [Paludibacter sp.]
MKISKSMLSKALLVAGFIFCSQLSFAGDTTPILLPPDNEPPRPGLPNRPGIEPSASATISDTDLAIYFEYSVGDATITVYDQSNTIVYQEAVDTDSTPEFDIPVGTWDSGIYTITVTYGTTTQRGSFAL